MALDRPALCFHPGASEGTCGPIISAHTLQMSRVLCALVNRGNHVQYFSPLDNNPDGTLSLQRRGWREASTFYGFCNRHDSTTFAPLEALDFAATPEQMFLLGYRAICWEMHRKMTALKALPEKVELMGRGRSDSERDQIRSMAEIQARGAAAGLDDMNRLKAEMDDVLLSREFSRMEYCQINLEGDLCVAATGAISPNRTVSGHSLQTLHDPECDVRLLSFGMTLNAQRQPVVGFCWQKTGVAPRRFVEDLLSRPDEMLSQILPQLFFLHCQNTYFSETWWNSLNGTNPALVRRLAGCRNPYYSDPMYSPDSKLVPWRVTSRRVF